MGESIFIEPIRRWFASRSATNQVEDASPQATLTPEQQLAQLRGLPVEVPGQAAAAMNGPVNPGTPLPTAIDNAVPCRQCGQGCAPDAKFCPFCASVLVPPMSAYAAPSTPTFPGSGARCAQCGRDCPDGYDLCADCTRLNPQAALEDESSVEVQRISAGNGASEISSEDQQPSSSVQVRSVNSASDDEDDESPNVTMADSLRNIFSGQSVINQDTVAFLERYGTVGTNELLDELRSLHKALR